MIIRTFDTALIRDILSDPVLSARVTDKGNVEMFDPANQEQLIYLLATDEKDTVLGFVLAHMFNSPICFQFHANYLPEFWGKGLQKYSTAAVQWVFNNTDAKKAVVLCPTRYPETKQHAIQIGFKEEGLLTNSSIFDGEICNNYIMGISKC